MIKRQRYRDCDISAIVRLSRGFGSELTFENLVAATCAWQMGFSNVSAQVVGSSKFNSEPDFENIILIRGGFDE